MSKIVRQATIRNLVQQRPIGSQDELRQVLVSLGHDVTQATLSRDVKELGLGKGPEGYFLPTSDNSPSVELVLSSFVRGIKQAQNLLIIRTMSGSAQPVAVAIDREDWDDVVGTIGGDDTVLVICPDNASAAQVKARIEQEIQ